MASQHSKLWHLEKINLFKDLSEEEMQTLDEKTVMKSAKKNDFVYFPKEPSKILFFLKRGRIKIGTYSSDGKEIIKKILYPGEVFGEMGIVGEETRKDFAMALDDDTRMCTLNIDEFKEMMEANPRLGMEITKQIGERLRNVERRLEALIFKDARERIIDFMKEM